MKHVHKFTYYGGEAKCSCGKYLQPDGTITSKPERSNSVARKKRQTRKKWGKIGAPKSAKRRAWLRKLRGKRR